MVARRLRERLVTGTVSGVMKDEHEIRAKLESTVGPVLASDLRAHLARDALFVVAPALGLIDCGVAIALDDAAKVEAWIASGALRRPTADERTAWLADPTRRWSAIVVQPFVLVQDSPGET